jgi:hypothetical protein
MVFFAIVTVLGLGMLLLMVFLNARILASNAPKPLRLLVQALASPADYHSPLGMVAIDVSQEGGIARFEFSNKYVGRHVVGLYLAKFQDDLYFAKQVTRHPRKLRLAMGFAIGAPAGMKQSVKVSLDPFIGKSGSGFTLYEYDVPNDLPIAQKITCEVEVIQSDLEMQQTYGPIQLFVRKTSDK